MVAQVSDSYPPILVWKIAQLCDRLFKLRSRTLRIPAFNVKDCDRCLDYPLKKNFFAPGAALPKFFPDFVAIEKSTRVEQVYSALK